MGVRRRLEHFRESPEDSEFEFPSSFSADDRCYVHRIAAQMGLQTKSRGKGVNRSVTVFKKEGSTIVRSDAVFTLSEVSKKAMFALLQANPVTRQERIELAPPTERDRNPYLSTEGTLTLTPVMQYPRH